MRVSGLFPVCAGLMVALLLGATASLAFGQANLIALYEGDKANGPDGSIVLDSSGNDNHGVFVGSAGLTDSGVNGGALNFNADVSSMLVNTPALGNFDGIADNQAFTIGFWMAGGDTNPRNSSVFWAEGVEGATDRAIQSHTTWSNGQMYLDIGGCCSPTQRLNGVLDAEHIRASEGEEWSHFTYAMDDFGDTYIYVNGELYENADGFVFERLGPTDEIPSIANFAIASDNNGNNQWEGRMDDFFIADNALSEADVAKVYNDGVRSVFTDLPAEPEDYTPTGDVVLSLEQKDGQLAGQVYVASGDAEVAAWRVEEIFTTVAGGQEISVDADLGPAGVMGDMAAGDADNSVFLGEVPLTNSGADDIVRTFRLLADFTGGDDPVVGGDFSRSLIGQITLPGSGEGGIPELVLKGDIDQNNEVGFGDFLILSANYGLQGEAAQAGVVPEPSSYLMALVSMLGLLGMRRRR